MLGRGWTETSNNEKKTFEERDVNLAREIKTFEINLENHITEIILD